MRVLQVSKFYTPIRGGIETVAWELAEGLNRSGIGTDVLCSNHGRSSVHENTQSGYEVHRAGSWGMLLSTSMAPTMVGMMRRLAPNYDVLHVHMPDPMAAFSLWCTRPRSRIVVHWHSDIIRQRWALKLYKPLQSWLLARADAIIATSQPYAQASEPLQPFLNKVEVIPIGISEFGACADAEAVAALRQRFGNRRMVFALGRMTYYKGFDVLIRAAQYLPEDFVVVVGGDGELLETHRAAVRLLGLGSKIHFVGHVNDGDLPTYFSACDAYCMSSTVRAEAYGVAMVEAMAMGRPIVATDISGSGVPWVNIAGLTGFNVPVGQAESLAEVLRHLLASPELCRQLGLAARARYEQEFHADGMINRTISLYERLMGRSYEKNLAPRKLLAVKRLQL